MAPVPRLNRLFAPDGKCFDLAVDLAVFNEHDFLAVIDDLGKTVAAAVEAETRKGAQMGNLFMSLIHTCELNDVNAFDCLTKAAPPPGVETEPAGVDALELHAGTAGLARRGVVG